jgi:hypothetical protein
MNKGITLGITLGVILFLLSGCGETPIHDRIAHSPQTLEEYHKNIIPAEEKSTVNNSIQCFFDYSAGVKDAMAMTAKFNSDLVKFLEGQDVQFYSIGENDEPEKIEMASKEANLTDENNYIQKGSKLGVAISQMANNLNAQSLFVTDFERVDNYLPKTDWPKPGDFSAPHPIEEGAWAQKEFQKWLAEGNQIDIYAAPYAREDAWFAPDGPKIKNHIYTIAFTPKNWLGNEKSVINYLNEKTETNNDYKHYTFNADNIIVQSKDKDKDHGVLHSMIVPQWRKKGGNFDYYQISYEDLETFYVDESMQYEENQKKDKRVINKLIIKSGMDCFDDVKFDIKVYDVTNTFVELLDYSENSAMELEYETTDNVEEGNVDSTLVSPQVTPYNFSKGTIVNDMFGFTYNDKGEIGEVGEVGLTLKDNFNSYVNVMFRVDFLVSDVSRNEFVTENKPNNETGEVLSIKYKDDRITSLPSSLDYALRSLQPDLKEKVVYSVYFMIHE